MLVLIRNDHVNIIREQEFVERLNEEYYGELKFLKQLPSNGQDFMKEDEMLVIDGKVIIPKAKEKVTEWEL